MLKRSEVQQKDTWDLRSIFKSEEEFERALHKYVENAEAFSAKYKGKLHQGDVMIKALEAHRELLEQYTHLETYVHLNISTDLHDPEHNERRSRFVARTAEVQTSLSFLISEISAVEAETIEEVISVSPENRHVLLEIEKNKKHRLHEKSEETIKALSPVINATAPLYNKLKLADMDFGSFEVKGKTYPLSFVLFENEYDYEENRDIRRKAYEVFSQTLSKYQHSMAFNYQTHLMNEKIMARLRGFDSTISYLLDKQDVTREMYDRQIDIIMEELAPAMRKYAGLLKKRHGLEKMTFNDLKLVIDPEFEPDITQEQSREYLVKGLEVLGEDYTQLIERAFDERWIDFAVNDGKASGAFCSSPYGVHPYILISWTSKMREVFVLAHELGHAGHFYRAQKKQNITDCRPSMYFIEAPSTFNELLMAQHLLSESKSDRMTRWIYSTMIARTYYHNFVTHLQEAHFQRKVYALIDQGKGVSAQVLKDLYADTLRQFWGDAVEIDEYAGLTWMRQQHYYKGLYPYTYSAGLTVSTVMAQKVKEHPEAIEQWKEVLDAGGTKNPVELAALAGIDISNADALKETVSFITFLVDEIERLTEKLEESKER